MKRILLITFILAISTAGNQAVSQLLGKWVIPIGQQDYPEETHLLEFYPSGIQSSVIGLPTIIQDDDHLIADAAFDPNYNLDFYIISDYLYINSHSVQWYTNPSPFFLPECQIIRRPGFSNRYYIFYSYYDPGKHFDN